MADPADRLDSWKAIAQYLGRDERTLRRWEKQGLPVRRVASSAGHSVFAFKSEVDAWLKTARPAEPSALTAPRPHPARWTIKPRVLAAGAVVMCGIVSWTILAPMAIDPPVRVRLTPRAVEALDADGATRWRFVFPADQLIHLSVSSVDPVIIGPGEPPLVYAMTSHATRPADQRTIGGTLYQLTLDGRLLRTFSLQDRWRFSDGHTYEGVWPLTDFRLNDHYGPRIVVTAHHDTWWPGIVTMLDDRWARTATFVNSGWVETVRWLSPDRIVIGGFNNGRDGGMMAVLDANGFDGASPENAAGPFACVTCPATGPLFYAVFPRSELNRITGSGFNRAWISVDEDGIVARTSELDRPTEIGPLSDAIYRFSSSLALVDARYGDRYWDHHRRLELEGRIRHTRAQCPERDGPPAVDVWTREAGWRRLENPVGRGARQPES